MIAAFAGQDRPPASLRWMWTAYAGAAREDVVAPLVFTNAVSAARVTVACASASPDGALFRIDAARVKSPNARALPRCVAAGITRWACASHPMAS